MCNAVVLDIKFSKKLRLDLSNGNMTAMIELS